MIKIFSFTAILVIFLGISAPALSEAPQLTLQKLMNQHEFKSAGLYKLSPSELKSLNKWLNSYTLEIIEFVKQKSKPLSRAPSAPSGPNEYEIEKAINDEKFIINGELFEAQTYCLGWEEGDRVIFVEGSAYGACASAKLLNRRTGEICDVWCE